MTGDSTSDDPEQPARIVPTQTRFMLGRLVATPGAFQAILQTEMKSALARHTSGDWGDVEAEDRAANEQAIEQGSRILSAYQVASGAQFWVLTEADRSVTTVMLPDEY